MKIKQIPKRRLILFLGLIFSLLLFGAAKAAADGFDLTWWTVDGGGATLSGGSYTLAGSVGQPDAGTLSGGDYTLDGGFWHDLAQGTPQPTPTITATPSGTLSPTPDGTVSPTPSATAPANSSAVYLPLLRK